MSSGRHAPMRPDKGDYLRIIATLTPREIDFLGGESPLARRIRLLARVCVAWPYPYHAPGPWALLVDPLREVRRVCA